MSASRQGSAIVPTGCAAMVAAPAGGSSVRMDHGTALFRLDSAPEHTDVGPIVARLAAPWAA